MDFEKELNELKAKMTPAGTFKFIVGTLISLGATTAVIALMKMPLLSTKGITKLLMKLGILVLACKAGETAEDFFRDKFDELEAEMKEGKETIQEVMKNGGSKNG